MNRTEPRGQTLVEFALAAVVFLGLLFGVIDLARAAFAQHNLNSGAADLARSLAAASSVNNSGDPYTYQPTPLVTATVGGPVNVITPTVQTKLQQAARVAGGAFAATPLTSTVTTTTTGAMTLTNGQLTVVGTPDLTAPREITVTVTVPFTPVVGLFLGNKILHFTGQGQALTLDGEAGL
jgi:Flp pilus assembly protein TadG